MELESTGRFRVNANGRLYDVWLIYRCPHCGSTRRRSIHRRVREDARGSLDAYRNSDREAAVHWAFRLSGGEPVAYRVERPPLPIPGVLDVQIEQPIPCGARWDVFLARELGSSRSHVRSAWRAGALLTAPAVSAHAVVRDSDRLRAQLDPAGRLMIRPCG